MSSQKHSNSRQTHDSQYIPRQESNIKVYSRFRPLFEHEKFNSSKQTLRSLFHQITPKVLGFGPENDIQSFTFDAVFGPNSTQSEIFEAVGRPILSDTLLGYNGTIFAYGQTGSGKTYTMMGEVNDEQAQGMIPKMANEIFTTINSEAEEDTEYLIKLSILEIYKDKLIDLLNFSAGELKIKQTATKGVFVSGLTVVCPTNSKEFMDAVLLGQEMRTVASTKMNSCSSRSHMLLTVELIQNLPSGIEKRGQLNLIDLAGSEKVRHSGVTGINLDETKKINLSLSALGNVISSLVSGKDHIPYRDSKLTRLLQDSLGGNYKTSLIVNCSPALATKEETLNSLNFAVRAKAIKNKAKINIKESPDSYLKTIEHLRQELNQARAEIQSLKGKNLFSETRTVSHSYVGRKGKKALSSLIVQKKSDNKLTVESPLAIGSNRNTPISVEFSLNDKKGFCFEQETSICSFLTPERPSDEVDHLRETQEDQENRKKLKKLEEKIEDLKEENSKLAQKLKLSSEKIVELEQKSLEYYTLYHKTLNLIQKDSNDYLILMKKNEVLNKSLKKLIGSLQEQEKKLAVVTELQGSRDATQVEFMDTVFSSSRVKTTEIDELLESSSEFELTVKELSLCPEKFSFCSTYGEQLENALESNKTLSKDLIIYQLKNQLIEASIFNSNLAWKLESMNWKMNLIKNRLGIKILQNKQSKHMLGNCEKMIEVLYKGFQKSNKVVESPTTSEKKTKILRSFFAKSFKSTSDPLDPSFQSLSIYPSFEIDPEGLTCRLKSFETRIQVLETFNSQLKSQYDHEKTKSKHLKSLSASTESKLLQAFNQEKQNWVKFFSESKKNCQLELSRKQEELKKLNEILAEWINRFIELQEGLISKEMHRKVQLLMINTTNFFSQYNPITTIYQNSPLN